MGRKERKPTFSLPTYLPIPEEKLSKILSEEWLKHSYNPVADLTEEFKITEELMRKRLEVEGVLVFKRLTHSKLKQRG